ncbi:hypothetical protein PRIC1_012049 [Phytophthora ramorum]
MSTGAGAEHQRVLERLMHDVQWKKTLCRAKDYPGVTIEELNKSVLKHGPLKNPMFGEVSGFWVDEGYFTPVPVPIEFSYEVREKILSLLRCWDGVSRRKGSILFSQGAYVFDARTGSPTTVRTPDISYIPRCVGRDLSDQQLWEYAEEPYNPSFVVEIDKLCGEDSQLGALDRKMRNEFFQHSVQLGWLIDSRPGCHKMYEYKRDESGKVYRVNNDEWRDLDGGAVLPGFSVLAVDLEMATDLDADSSEDEDWDLLCPYPGCDERLPSSSVLLCHVKRHQIERYMTKRAAKDKH